MVLQAALGKQCLSTMASAPNLGFGSAKRPGMAQKAAAPGPGAYKLKPALGGPSCLKHRTCVCIVCLHSVCITSATVLILALSPPFAGICDGAGTMEQVLLKCM